MSLKKTGNIFLNEVMQKWQQLQQVPNVFAYKFKVNESKYFKGKYCFYLQLNPERTTLRRPPQTILSLNPAFDEEKFNFKKVAKQEILLKLQFEDDTDISFIINKSPLTLYHTLICPNVEKGLAQRITLNSLRFCVDFLLSIEQNRYFRIGYNSPGALASVNHLHLQLLYVDKELYVDRVQLKRIAEPDIYRLDESMPTEAICFMFDATETKSTIEAKVDKLYTFIQWLCENNIPHNLFMTPKVQENKDSLNQQLNVFVYAREEFCFVKDLTKCNLGFCELSGYVTVGDKELYNQITEDDIITKIQSETGQVFTRIYKYFKKI